jgi:hypothetical protein
VSAGKSRYSLSVDQLLADTIPRAPIILPLENTRVFTIPIENQLFSAQSISKFLGVSIQKTEKLERQEAKEETGSSASRDTPAGFSTKVGVEVRKREGEELRSHEQQASTHD